MKFFYKNREIVGADRAREKYPRPLPPAKESKLYPQGRLSDETEADPSIVVTFLRRPAGGACSAGALWGGLQRAFKRGFPALPPDL